MMSFPTNQIIEILLQNHIWFGEEKSFLCLGMFKHFNKISFMLLLKVDCFLFVSCNNLIKLCHHISLVYVHGTDEGSLFLIIGQR